MSTLVHSKAPARSRREAAAALRVETIEDDAAFASLRDEWGALLQESPSDCLFLTWQWLHTWWTHLRGESRLAILAVRRGSDLLAIAPLASRAAGLAGCFGVRQLEFLGTGAVGSDYLDVIVLPGAEQDAIPALARHLARQGALVDLRQVRLTASATERLVRDLHRSGSRIRAMRTHRCPYIDLRGASFESYLGGLGSEHRYNFHRRQRRLEKQYHMSFERVSSEERRRELLPVLFELHRRRWSERGGSDGFEGLEIESFHQELSRVALEQGWLRLFVLWLEGSPAAALYGFRYGGVFSFYQSGFDPRYGKLSVGLVAMGLAIKSAIQEGASEFDMLHGEEPYKFHWASRARRLARVTVYPPGLLGGLGRTAAAARGAARRSLRLLHCGMAARISAARSRTGSARSRMLPRPGLEGEGGGSDAASAR